MFQVTFKFMLLKWVRDFKDLILVRSFHRHVEATAESDYCSRISLIQNKHESQVKLRKFTLKTYFKKIRRLVGKILKVLL